MRDAIKTIDFHDYEKYLQPRPRDWHKGLSGHVLIVGGYAGFSGAPMLAGEAALRVGAGLVSLATHPSHAGSMNAGCREIMCHAIHEASDVEGLLKRADVLVIGPGLSQSDWGRSLFEKVCASTLPTVLDADALRLLSETAMRSDHWILTPHPGEAAGLLNTTTEVIQADRLKAALAISAQYGGVCVLKGAGTIVVDASGEASLCDRGNPGMASAGMGDVLSGVIGGLLAQRIPLSVAAKLGVLLHAMAGDLAAIDGERGTIASDLLLYLRQLVNDTRSI